MPNRETSSSGITVELPNSIRFDGMYDPTNSTDLYAHYIRLGSKDRRDLMQVLAEKHPMTMDSLLNLLQSDEGKEERYKHYDELANQGTATLTETRSQEAIAMSNNNEPSFQETQQRATSWDAVDHYMAQSGGGYYPRDPAGHDDIVAENERIHAEMFGEYDRELTSASKDPAYRAMEADVYSNLMHGAVGRPAE